MTGPAPAPHVRFGWLAAILAFGALVADVLVPAAGLRRVPFVTPIELARWIRAGTPDLDLVDVRDAADYDAGHIPGARNAPLSHFDGAPAAPHATVVVYATVSGDAIAGATRAVATGLAASVYVLERGLDGWLDDVMSPRIDRDATESESAAFREQSELSRWFGGIPRVVDSAVDRPTEPARSTRLLGGC